MALVDAPRANEELARCECEDAAHTIEAETGLSHTRRTEVATCRLVSLADRGLVYLCRPCRTHHYAQLPAYEGALAFDITFPDPWS